MTDRLGHRCVFGVIAPSVNTTMQPEYDDLRPSGVTNQFARFMVETVSVAGDRDFNQMMAAMPPQMLGAIDQILTAAPDHLLIGLSTEALAGGIEATGQYAEQFAARAGIPITMPPLACVAALRALGARRIGIISPFMPQAQGFVDAYFRANGFEVLASRPLCCAAPLAIARVTEDEVFAALAAVEPGVDALLQVGTNLSTAYLVDRAEARFGKPLVSVNVATYWGGLRTQGIDDRVNGFGTLIREY